MSASTQVAQSYNVQFSGNGTSVFQADCPSPALSTGALACSWNQNILQTQGLVLPYSFNFTNIVSGQGLFKGPQSAFVDNSQCSFPVALVDGSGCEFITPAGCQAIYEVQFSTNQNFSLFPAIPYGVVSQTLQTAGLYGETDVLSLQTTINFYNYKLVPKIWKSKDFSSPIGIFSHANPYQTALLSNDRLTVNFSGTLASPGGNGTISLDSVELDTYGVNSFAIDEVVSGVLVCKYLGAQTATPNGIISLNTGTIASAGFYGANCCVPQYQGPEIFDLDGTSTYDYIFNILPYKTSMFWSTNAVSGPVLSSLLYAGFGGFNASSISEIILNVNVSGAIIN